MALVTFTEEIFKEELHFLCSLCNQEALTDTINQHEILNISVWVHSKLKLYPYGSYSPCKKNFFLVKQTTKRIGPTCWGLEASKK